MHISWGHDNRFLYKSQGCIMIMQVEPLHAKTDPKISAVGLLSDCLKGWGTHPEMLLVTCRPPLLQYVPCVTDKHTSTPFLCDRALVKFSSILDQCCLCYTCIEPDPWRTFLNAALNVKELIAIHSQVSIFRKRWSDVYSTFPYLKDIKE